MTEIDKYDIMPFIALIHHISRNKLKYAMNNPNHIDMVNEGRYLIEIHKRKNLSQDDLATLFGQSKGTIAKALKKLEKRAILLLRFVDNCFIMVTLKAEGGALWAN